MTDKKKVTAREPEKAKEEVSVAETSSTGRQRPTRITRDMLVKKGPLVIPVGVKKEGFHYHWMRDDKYKFDQYAQLGFDFALDSLGRKISVGEGEGAMFLLEIPNELHKQIKDLKAELRREKTADRQGITKPRQSGSPERIFEERLEVK